MVIILRTCGLDVVWCGVMWGGVVCRRRCYQMAMAKMALHLGKCKPGGLRV